MTHKLSGNIIALFAVMLASTYTIFNKILVVDIPPVTLAAVSQGLSVFVLLLFFGAIPEFKKIIAMPVKEVAAMIVMGVLGTVAAPLLFLKGLQYSSATNAILLAELDTIFVPLIATLWLKEKVTGNQIGGTVLMVGGLYFIFTGGLQESLDFRFGDLLIALSAFCLSLSLNIFKKYLHHVPSERVVIVSDTIGVGLLLFAAPTLLNLSHRFAPIFEPAIFKPLLIFAILGIAVSRFLWFKALDQIPAHRASIISLCSPVMALLLAAVVLKEPLAFYHMIGAALVIVGLGLGVFHEGKNKVEAH